ncbi:unnamed protein product [Hymenolepis diminuta]|uniref:Uncharacterized protein n=1 Tax=Hymenolepis diminuta TaxID=6216 RepID=A0A564Z3I9_HYMDI|nr:unnamed protein product [Hymenolepis diminuta]
MIELDLDLDLKAAGVKSRVKGLRRSGGVHDICGGRRGMRKKCIAHLGNDFPRLILGKEWHHGSSLVRDSNSLILYIDQIQRVRFPSPVARRTHDFWHGGDAR